MAETVNESARVRLEQQFLLLEECELNTFISRAPTSVLFFAGDPKKYPESQDLAIVLPELEKHFAGRFQVALIASNSEANLQKRYGFTRWPSLVLVNPQGYLGTISRIQDWQTYLTQFKKFEASQPHHPPSIGIPVVSDTCSTQH